MTSNSERPPLTERPLPDCVIATLRRGVGISPAELDRRRIRRRLLRFILENHCRREAERGLGNPPVGATA